LYGNVTEDTIEEEQSTRNRVLMRFMEDLHLVENRGSGTRTMIDAMRKANLEPPKLKDKRTSFWVTFRSHTLMRPESIAWLNQFASLPINDHQRLAMVYLQNNEQITNSDYQRLNHVDSVIANRELSALSQIGLIIQHKTKRWAFYTLTAPVKIEIIQPPQPEIAKILAYIREFGSINNSECRKLLGIDLQKASHLLKKMNKKKILRKEGERHWAKYYLP
jgi:predicted HTH transcriptional regulator